MVAGVTIYFYLKARHAERMALIDKGLSLHQPKRQRLELPTGFRIGMLSIGIGTGILVGYILFTIFPAMKEIAVVASIFLFGGFGLVISYFVDFKTFQKEAQKEFVDG